MYEDQHDQKPTVVLAIGFVVGAFVTACGFLGLVGLPHVG
jgi:ABC-type cobalamin transport system permease subunit